MLVPLTPVIMHTPWGKIPNTQAPRSYLESKQKMCVLGSRTSNAHCQSSRAKGKLVLFVLFLLVLSPDWPKSAIRLKKSVSFFLGY